MSLGGRRARAEGEGERDGGMVPNTAYLRLTRPAGRTRVARREVVASSGYLDLPRGREAGESPAQSRYGDHPSDGEVEVRSPGPRSMLYLREKGQATMRTSG
jgi:hypothetical protein